MLPFVSCICPTYNRFPEYRHLVEEAIESFLRQDYPHDRRELLILNDAPGQVLGCAHPGVFAINLPERFATLGGKYNWLVNAARGELICPWEDDDVSLPWRISQAVEALADTAYWNPHRTWFLDGRGLHWTHHHGVCHNASIYRKQAWRKVGGYPEISGAQDALFDALLRRLGPLPAPLGPEPFTWSYIYRWGVQPYHLSGRMPHDQHYADIGRLPVEPGRFELIGRWRQDYLDAIARARAV